MPPGEISGCAVIDSCPSARPGLICSGDIARGRVSTEIDSVEARCEVNTGTQLDAATLWYHSIFLNAKLSEPATTTQCVPQTNGRINSRLRRCRFESSCFADGRGRRPVAWD